MNIYLLKDVETGELLNHNLNLAQRTPLIYASLAHARSKINANIGRAAHQRLLRL